MKDKIGIISLISLPTILGVLGARLELPSLTLAMLVVISVVVGLVSFGRVIPKKLYPFTLLSIGAGILLSSSLVSNYLIGTDIHTEYYYYLLALDGWDMSLPHGYNSAIGLVLIAPTLSRIFDIEGYWIFKIIYPLLFAFTPVILYLAYREFLEEKRAFLGVFLFIAFPAFMIEGVSLAKLQLSSVFLGILVLLLFKSNMRGWLRITLGVICGILVGASYYSFGYVLFIYLILGLGGLTLLRFIPWLRGNVKVPYLGYLVTLVLIIGPTCLYFNSVSDGQPFKTLVFYGKEHILNIDPTRSQFASDREALRSRWEWEAEQRAKETGEEGGVEGEGKVIEWEGKSELSQDEQEAMERLLREPVWTQVGLKELGVLPGNIPPPGAKDYILRAALGLDLLQTPWLGRVFRLFQIATQVLIVIGFVVVFLNRKKYPDGFLLFVIVSLGALLVSLVKPGFSTLFGMPKLYFITLFFLSPLFIIGGEWVFKFVFKRRPLVSLILLLLIPYFAFTSGFVFEVTRRPHIESFEVPYSVGLSSHRIDIFGVFTESDKVTSDWLQCNLPEDIFLFADLHGMELLYEWGHTQGVFHFPQNWLPQDLNLIPDDSWIFFREWNEETGLVTHWVNMGLRESISYEDRGVPKLLDGREVIYKSGNAVVYGGKQ